MRRKPFGAVVTFPETLLFLRCVLNAHESDRFLTAVVLMAFSTEASGVIYFSLLSDYEYWVFSEVAL